MLGFSGAVLERRFGKTFLGLKTSRAAPVRIHEYESGRDYRMVVLEIMESGRPSSIEKRLG